MNTPAVSGYEQELAAKIREKLKDFSPKSDNLGNVYVTLGSGAPHRLIVTPMDEPGYIVTGITADGYLRVQRLPQAAPNGVFDLLHAAQPVWVITRGGKRVNGVFAGLSVHLEPQRQNVPKMAHPDEMYVDIGADNAEEVRAAGVDLLDPITLRRAGLKLASEEYTAPAAGDHFGCIALTELLTRLRVAGAKLPGTLTVAFVTQQWTGGRGLDRLLNELHPDEMIYVGRFVAPHAGAPAENRASLGKGILLAAADPSAPLAGFSAELKKLSDDAGVAVGLQGAAPPRIASYAKPTALPERFAQLGVATLLPVTPAETMSMNDVGSLTELLFRYASGTKSTGGIGGGSGSGCGDCGPSLLPALVETYGASGHEDAVRKEVQAWLNRAYPSKKKLETETDSAGNLILHLGDGKKDAKTPRIVFVAHMDEIGYQVRSIETDGRLLVDVLGGGYTEYFLGHGVLVHEADGTMWGGVLELPAGWDKAEFRISARAEDEGRASARLRGNALCGRNAEAGHPSGRLDHDSEGVSSAVRHAREREEF